MGRLPGARGSCSNWSSTWRPSTQLPRDTRACPPSSSVCRGKHLSGPTPYEDFTRRFRAVFDHPPEGRAAGERLFHLRQGMRRAQDFALDFRTLAASAGWNERALIDHYRFSLREVVRRELACRDTTLTLDQLVDLSIRLDNLLATRGRPDRGPSIPSPSTSDPTPMELGGAALRVTGGGAVSCTTCGRRGHTAGRCWGGSPGSRGSRQGTGGSSQVSRHPTHLELPVAYMCVCIEFPEFSPHSQHKALVDSGAAGDFIDRSFALRLGIPIVPVDVPFLVHALDSRPLGSGLHTPTRSHGIQATFALS